MSNQMPRRNKTQRIAAATWSGISRLHRSVLRHRLALHHRSVLHKCLAETGRSAVGTIIGVGNRWGKPFIARALLIILCTALIFPAMAAPFPWEQSSGEQSPDEQSRGEHSLKEPSPEKQPPVAQPTTESPGDRDARSAPPQVEGQKTNDQADIKRTVNRLVAEMNSQSFTTRERAMTQLFDLGVRAVGPLRRRINDGIDRERAERLRQVVQRLSDGDLASRVDQFLAGEAIQLEGWSWTRALMGDNRAVRKFFVDLMREFPEATPKLDGVTRDRGTALKLFAKEVKEQLQFGGRVPTRASTVCLLLPIVDEGVPIDQEIDEMVLLLVRRTESLNALQDKAFADSYKRLIGAWMRRSDSTSRERVFDLGLRLELSVVIDLAAETLHLAAAEDATEEQRRPSLIASALQVMGARGVPRELDLVTPFLDDDRPAIRDTFYGGRRIRTEVGDVAAAAVVRLLRKDFSEFGFGDARPDPLLGFLFSDIGFTVGDEAGRLAMKNHVRQLIAADQEMLRGGNGLNAEGADENGLPLGIPQPPE